MTLATIVPQKTLFRILAGLLPVWEAKEIWNEDQKGGKEPQSIMTAPGKKRLQNRYPTPIEILEVVLLLESSSLLSMAPTPLVLSRGAATVEDMLL